MFRFIKFNFYLKIKILLYENEGTFNIICQIPKILYSLIISGVINAIINFLSLSEKDVLEIKSEKRNKKEKAKKVLKWLAIKFVLFFILDFIFLMLFWCYLSCSI